jgi:hypothetical protein
MGQIIERIARAITIADGDDPDGRTGSLLNEGEVWWQHRIPHARAAIAELRDILNLTNNSSLNYTADELDDELRE